MAVKNHCHSRAGGNRGYKVLCVMCVITGWQVFFIYDRVLGKKNEPKKSPHFFGGGFYCCVVVTVVVVFLHSAVISTRRHGAN